MFEPSQSAYAYPLLIKHLLHTPLAHAPDQEIVYRGETRLTYRAMQERIARLANGLGRHGAVMGSTVAVMDWDSHRYLECYFAIPMMGAVLQTVNVRLSPAEIAYTINHAGAQILLVHTDFLPVIESIRDQLESVRTFILIEDEGSAAAAHAIPFADEYESMLAASEAAYDFPDFDENTRATTFYTTGTTGLPKGVYFSHRQLVLHTITGMAALASGLIVLAFKLLILERDMLATLDRSASERLALARNSRTSLGPATAREPLPHHDEPSQRRSLSGMV